MSLPRSNINWAIIGLFIMYSLHYNLTTYSAIKESLTKEESDGRVVL